MINPLWTPSSDRIAAANLTRFGRGAPYSELYDWSIAKPDEFWSAIWDFGGIIGHKGARVVTGLDRMPGATFFPDAQLNFTENLLREDGPGEAIVFRSESGEQRTLSWSALRTEVGAAAAALRAAGIQPGDRVASYLGNVPEAIVGVLGAAAIGAVWSSCSPDFGVQGVLDRFGQIEPRVLFAADSYHYSGKAFDQRPKIAAALETLPTVERTIIGPGGWEDVRRAAPRHPLGLRSAPVQPSALHPVFIRHDRRSQVHRPRRGRHA